MLVEVKTSEYVDKGVVLPFYALLEDSDFPFDRTYVKITKTDHVQIQFEHSSIKVFSFQNPNHIADIWYKNQCSKEEWNDAVKSSKKFFAKVLK